MGHLLLRRNRTFLFHTGTGDKTKTVEELVVDQLHVATKMLKRTRTAASSALISAATMTHTYHSSCLAMGPLF